jgi:2-polyprenyl-6-hydroxyphenyl methylase/3-demethylubiquinone-9 3-methyltransferase
MSLTERETHFEFGENWKNYSRTVDQKRIDSAIAGVKKLFPDGLAGKTFLDIGCGSGLHSLAALSLGAASVTAVDIDENSVATTQELLAKYAPDAKWIAKTASVFDLSPETSGTFDVVYSWGVLHHTGEMWRAIEMAAALVKSGGQFAIAIYYATRYDQMWKAEKRFYSHAPRSVQWILRQGYTAAFLATQIWFKKNPIAFIRDYSSTRGMNSSNDVHDWLGGYPYETASAEEMRARISAFGFKEDRSFLLPVSSGLFGSGCHEFVFTNQP